MENKTSEREIRIETADETIILEKIIGDIEIVTPENVIEEVMSKSNIDAVEIVAPDVWNEHLKEEIAKTEQPLTKKELALSFMLAKDTVKVQLKRDLNIALRNHPDRVVFIGSLFSERIAHKQLRNVNFATKRIVLNNKLRVLLLNHSARTGEATNNILVLLENDTAHPVYLHNLKIALSEVVAHGISLK